MSQIEIMVDIDCNSESSMDGKDIFSDDLVEGTNDNREPNCTLKRPETMRGDGTAHWLECSTG